MDNPKPVIIALIPIPAQLPSYGFLHEHYNVVYLDVTSDKDIFKTLSLAPYRDAVAIYGSYPGFAPAGGLLTADRIHQLPPNLKVISLASAGFGGNDLKLLRDANVNLCHVPTGSGQGDVADCVIWHILSGVRKFQAWDLIIRNEANSHGSPHTNKIRDQVDFYNKEPPSKYSFGHNFKAQSVRRVSELKAVILGYGGIGRESARRLNAMGVECSGVVRSVNNYQSSTNAKGEPIDDLNTVLYSVDKLIDACARKDIVILCLPGTKETDNILNEKIINVLNDSSIIVNVGRGSLVNEDDVKFGCESGKIGHVGFDVFPNEPDIDSFWVQDNDYFTTTLTPHIAVSTEDSYLQACEKCVQHILKGLEDNDWQDVVN